MTIAIDHITVPAADNEAAARFFAQILGRPYAGPDRHFAPVTVSPTFKLVFYSADPVPSYHIGFHVTDDEIDGIVERLTAAGVAYGNDPRTPDNLRTDHPFGGRGLYFVDPDGHLFEVMTRRDFDPA